jgi:hypothetical protein
MAFPVDSIVKKIGGQQKYKVVEQDVSNDSSVCILQPKINPARFTFSNSDLELA